MKNVDGQVQQSIANAQTIFASMERFPGAHDPTVLIENAPKILGEWMVEPISYGFSYDSPNISWSEDDMFLNIGILPMGPERLTLDAMRRSHHLLARYVALTGEIVRDPHQNVGSITNRKMASVAVRAFGFNIAEIPEATLLERCSSAPEAVYNLHVGASSKEAFMPVFIYQTSEELVRRYAAEDTELAIATKDPSVFPDREYKIVSMRDDNTSFIQETWHGEELLSSFTGDMVYSS
jgi:hypothetical protein